MWWLKLAGRRRLHISQTTSKFSTSMQEIAIRVANIRHLIELAAVFRIFCENGIFAGLTSIVLFSGYVCYVHRKLYVYTFYMCRYLQICVFSRSDVYASGWYMHHITYSCSCQIRPHETQYKIRRIHKNHVKHAWIFIFMWSSNISANHRQLIKAIASIPKRIFCCCCAHQRIPIEM